MEELFRKAQKGDREAFSDLIQPYLMRLYKTAKAILYSDEDVADAVQETLLACWQKMKQVREAAFFKTWLTRVLINKCYDQLRKKEELLLDGDWEEEGQADTALENVEWTNLLRSLDEKYRLILVLHYMEGYTTKEISAILDIPFGTVCTRLLAGRKLLAKEYMPGKM